MRSPTLNVGYIESEGINRGSATNDRKASATTSAVSTVLASSEVTVAHSGNKPFFFPPLSSPSPPPPPPSQSPSLSPPPPPLFSANRGGASSASGAPRHLSSTRRRVLELKRGKLGKMGFLWGVGEWLVFKNGFFEEERGLKEEEERKGAVGLKEEEEEEKEEEEWRVGVKSWREVVIFSFLFPASLVQGETGLALARGNRFCLLERRALLTQYLVQDGFSFMFIRADNGLTAQSEPDLSLQNQLQGLDADVVWDFQAWWPSPGTSWLELNLTCIRSNHFFFFLRSMWPSPKMTWVQACSRL